MDAILSTATPIPSLPLALDHLVVAASTLDEGEAWLQARLGCPLLAGGSHPGFGTHNRLLGLGPDYYLELIALDPQQTGPRDSTRYALFGLDQEPVVRALADGPLLLHTVFRVRAPATLGTLPGRLDYDPGAVTRMTRGGLAWRITVPPRGCLRGDGLLPTIIDWEDTAHPCSRLPESGVRLKTLRLAGPAAVIAQFPVLPVAFPGTPGEQMKLDIARAPCSTISAELLVEGKPVIIQSRLPARNPD